MSMLIGKSIYGKKDKKKKGANLHRILEGKSIYLQEIDISSFAFKVKRRWKWKSFA